MAYAVEHVCSAHAVLGEGPVWHPVEQVLYFLDIVQGNLHRFDPAVGSHAVRSLGVVTGSMGLRSSGGFVFATQKGFALWDGGSESLDFVADPDSDHSGETRFNDGKTDPQGRFWAGKMGGVHTSTFTNSLFRLDKDHSAHRMESGIAISNGLGWSPDLKTFYYTDSQALVIYAYDYEAETGCIANRQVFARVPEGGGNPDGLAVDVEGCIWSARWDGWKVVRYRPDGSIDLELPMPVARPTSCAFGGKNLDELYITSAFVEAGDPREKDQPLQGDVFRVKVDVKGLPEPFYLG